MAKTLNGNPCLNSKLAVWGAFLAALHLAGCELFVGEDTGQQDAPLTVADPAARGWLDDEGESVSDPPAGARPGGTPGLADPSPQDRTSMMEDGSPGNGLPGPGGIPQPGMPPANGPGLGDPSLTCAGAPIQAQAVLTSYCSGCHGSQVNAGGGFSTILDVSALRASGKVVANDPDMSLLLVRMSNGSMPPASVQNRPDTVAIEIIETWINCGAEDWYVDDGRRSAAFASIDWRLDTVLADLRSTPNPTDRERYRYIDLSPLANAGYSDESLQVYREAVSFLLNSLSRGRTVIAPRAVDRRELLYRLDLRDYLWDADTWRELEADYPYAVIYDPDSRLFPFDEDTAEQIRDETGTEIPVIQADWFLSHGSRPPLYVSVLELPDTLQELEDDLGIDLQLNIDTEQVIRSGFANSEPSQNNRVIERHDLGGNRGAFWRSYDFASSVEFGNIFAHPLDFQEDGGEMIFNLDNGLQAYYVANAAGVRLDKAPNNVVQDAAARDGAVETGISCMNCHMTQGQLPKFDEIREFQLEAGESAQEIEEVLALYPPRAELQAYFEDDQARYQDALASLGIRSLTDSTMHELDNLHLGVLDIAVVAAVVGITKDQLERAIDASPQSFPQAIVTLRTEGGGIQRDAFEDVVEDLVLALGLGEQLLVDGANDFDRRDQFGGNGFDGQGIEDGEVNNDQSNVGSAEGNADPGSGSGQQDFGASSAGAQGGQ